MKGKGKSSSNELDLMAPWVLILCSAFNPMDDDILRMCITEPSEISMVSKGVNANPGGEYFRRACIE